MPLSLNRAPAPDLDPWIARVTITRVDAAPDFEVACGLCSDIAFQRVILTGEWEHSVDDKPERYDRESVLIGPHSAHFNANCKGAIATIGIGFRPGALRVLFGRDMSEIVDTVERGDPIGLMADESGDGDRFGYPINAPPEEWALLAEERVRKLIARLDPKKPDRVSAVFELASFVDPNIGPGEFAREHGINQRRLERLVKRDFGLTPRFVLRRARALDLAAQMLGIADKDEEADFLLRYFDQAHLIREFQKFFGVTPEEFCDHPRMLMTMNLEARSARRLEELDRLRPGEKRPWALA